MKTALALSLLLFTSSALAAVIGKDVSYQAGDTTMKGFMAYDDAVKDKRAGVLVVPEWWGANDYARKRARMLAEAGYVALVVDMYGNGQVADNPKDAGALAGSVNKNPDLAYARMDAARKFLDAQGNVKKGELAALGYCFGGGVVLNMARAGLPLKSVASYHGVLATDISVKPGQIKAKIRVFHGEADPVVPPEQVEAFKTEMANAKADYMLVAYPGVKHTFTNREADSYAAQFGLPLKYDPEADKDSWTRTLEFLKATLK
ncbi:MAG: dienelactone hydrolase [Hydrogenophilales bacterium 16-64-46]|nr:MAG: dienelactone hydrolase [Hydrogenophilales bacterium 12-64-13]OYZ05894.1 MAG: dienelactone hydrolase [Hydrogenophilales bacterium 16-64-46]OZA39830.1 MAG: dienelactone hydrolase [Hydrogenophilales bacterium 17-64-34]HQT00250.1 dienelactone hydrolase family protein [Thiobacillus sp.]